MAEHTWDHLVKSLEIQVFWSPGSKSWLIRATLAGRLVVPIRRVDTDYHGAPDAVDVRHLVAAVEGEIQRWLL